MRRPVQNVALDRDTWLRLRDYCREHGRTMTWTVNTAITQWIDQHKDDVEDGGI